MRVVNTLPQQAFETARLLSVMSVIPIMVGSALNSPSFILAGLIMFGGSFCLTLTLMNFARVRSGSQLPYDMEDHINAINVSENSLPKSEQKDRSHQGTISASKIVEWHISPL